MIKRIAHSTDFSPEGVAAFHHALALAMKHGAWLDLLHVHAFDEPSSFKSFPRVRVTLAGWGALPQGASTADVAALTGVKVNKVEIRDVDPVEGLTHYLEEHRPDLLVMASHARGTVSRLLKGSISGEVTHETQVPTLLIGPSARGFVNNTTGEISLKRVLVPVDHTPSPTRAVAVIDSLASGLAAELDLIHVGADAPQVQGDDGKALPVRMLSGDPVTAIVAEAGSADLLAMPTEGRKGLFDMLRGSTTDRVLHEASCPVLAIPVRRH